MIDEASVITRVPSLSTSLFFYYHYHFIIILLLLSFIIIAPMPKSLPRVTRISMSFNSVTIDGSRSSTSQFSKCFFFFFMLFVDWNILPSDNVAFPNLYKFKRSSMFFLCKYLTLYSFIGVSWPTLTPLVVWISTFSVWLFIYITENKCILNLGVIILQYGF